MEELFKAKRTDNGEWVKGYLMDENYINVPFNDNDACGRFDDPVEIDPETVCRCTGKEYIDGEIAYEGDIYKNLSIFSFRSYPFGIPGCGVIFVLKYGTYEAYCPADRCYMDNVGFYAEATGYPQMPIGNLKEYGLKIGNIFDNPELYEVIENEKGDR